MGALLIVGAPRSGTTWVGRALGRSHGATYVHEPDGFRDPYAFRTLLARGENPAVGPDGTAPDLEALWAGAFRGGREAGTWRDRMARRAYDRAPLDTIRSARSGGPVSARLRVAAKLAVPRVDDPAAREVVVKSVHGALAIEWIWQRFEPRVLVVERNPLNVLASWVELGYARDPRETARVAGVARDRWDLEPPPPTAPRLEQQTFFYGVLATALRDAVAAHPEWLVVRHEDLCVDAVDRFGSLVAEVGLAWSDDVERFLAESDRDGTPYRTQRRTSAQPERWRERLDLEQVRTIRATLARFPRALLREA